MHFAGIPYTHIASPMPDIYRSFAPIPRGVANRRAAINWIRNSGRKTGVLYFGDDDNAFDLRLFSEIRSTQRVSMFPVGLIGLYAVSTPIVKQVTIFWRSKSFFFYINKISSRVRSSDSSIRGQQIVFGRLTWLGLLLTWNIWH